jgi:hypothetical protein
VSQEQRIKRFQDLFRTHPAGDCDAQGFSRVLIEHRQHLVGSAGAELVVDKIDRPDVIGVQGPEPDHRGVAMIQPLALLVPVWLL